MNKSSFEIKTTLIRRAWKPSLAFKYCTTAEHKRRLHTFNKFKNYKETTGRPVTFYADPLANDEINQLRYIIDTFCKSLVLEND